MKENLVAKIVRITGWCIIIGGIIGAFILGEVLPTVTYNHYGRAIETHNWGLTVAVIIGSIISGVFFHAIAEIIQLLQLNVDKMEVLLKDSSRKAEHHSNSTLRDIESNLPKI